MFVIAKTFLHIAVHHIELELLYHVYAVDFHHYMVHYNRSIPAMVHTHSQLYGIKIIKIIMIYKTQIPILLCSNVLNNKILIKIPEITKIQPYALLHTIK